MARVCACAALGVWLQRGASDASVYVASSLPGAGGEESDGGAGVPLPCASGAAAGDAVWDGGGGGGRPWADARGVRDDEPDGEDGVAAAGVHTLVHEEEGGADKLGDGEGDRDARGGVPCSRGEPRAAGLRDGAELLLLRDVQQPDARHQQHAAAHRLLAHPRPERGRRKGDDGQDGAGEMSGLAGASDWDEVVLLPGDKGGVRLSVSK
mmetsp:Transcript_18361/g.60294  ORF Transcript_18361/g.60294 Transcript_18361/m.60294 type:complete len:209 (+) Transcript_18361:709-1335(+)